MPSARAPVADLRHSAIVFGSSGKCPRKVESERETKATSAPPASAASSAAATASRLTRSASSGASERELTMTYTAGAPVSKAQAKSPTSQDVKTGRPATDWVPVGSSSRTTYTGRIPLAS